MSRPATHLVLLRGGVRRLQPDAPRRGAGQSRWHAERPATGCPPRGFSRRLSPTMSAKATLTPVTRCASPSRRGLATSSRPRSPSLRQRRLGRPDLRPRHRPGRHSHQRRGQRASSRHGRGSLTWAPRDFIGRKLPESGHHRRARPGRPLRRGCSRHEPGLLVAGMRRRGWFPEGFRCRRRSRSCRATGVRWREDQPGADPEAADLGALLTELRKDGSLLLHGEQEFRYHAPVAVGMRRTPRARSRTSRSRRARAARAR